MGYGLSHRRSAGFAAAIGHGALRKVENERLDDADRAQSVGGNHNFHQLPPEKLGPAGCKFRRSNTKPAPRGHASASQSLGWGIKRHAKTAALELRCGLEADFLDTPN